MNGSKEKRRLVLSQFTFFNQVGVAKPTGSTFRRGRRCYRLEDLLSIACILALKEEGVPYKNVQGVPAMVQDNSSKIFFIGEGCRITGFGLNVVLSFPGEQHLVEPFIDFLSGDNQPQLFWSYDVGLLAEQLRAVAEQYLAGDLQRAAA